MRINDLEETLAQKIERKVVSTAQFGQVHES